MLGRLGLYKLIMSGGIVSGLGLASLSLGTTWPAEMAIFMVVGIGFYMIHNSLQTQATELAPHNRGSAVAMHAFFVFLGQAFGPIIYGVGLPGLGTGWWLLLTGTAMGLLGIATAWALRARSGLVAANVAGPPVT